MAGGIWTLYDLRDFDVPDPLSIASPINGSGFGEGRCLISTRARPCGCWRWGRRSSPPDRRRPPTGSRSRASTPRPAGFAASGSSRTTGSSRSCSTWIAEPSTCRRGRAAGDDAARGAARGDPDPRGRASEVKAAEERAARDRTVSEAKAAQDKVAAEDAREQPFFDREDLQVSRLGTETNFTFVDDVRTNPFHFRKLGLAIVRTQFDRMVSFGNDLAPVVVHIDDVDRFTRSGETVMLAFKVVERGEVERSYGSLPEIVVSAMKAAPIFGAYVGAYTCPGNDCMHVFDVPPPTDRFDRAR